MTPSHANMLSYYRNHRLGACRLVADHAERDIRQLIAELDRERQISLELAVQSQNLREELERRQPA